MARNESIAESPVDAACPPAAPVALDAEFELRWAAWHARGVGRERVVRRTFLLPVRALAIGAAIAYAVLRR